MNDKEKQEQQQARQARLIEDAKLAHHERVTGNKALGGIWKAKHGIYVVGYPRSGSTWFKSRVYTICVSRNITREEKNQLINVQHFGYNPISNYNPDRQPRFSDIGVIVLLREAKSVLASHFILFDSKAKGSERNLASLDPAGFALGNFGVQRLCGFLNNVQEIIQDRSAEANIDISYVYYEDMFGPDRLDVFADALKLGSGLMATERESLLSSLDKQEQIDKYTLTFDAETAAKIDTYVDEHCKLDAYRERYL